MDKRKFYCSENYTLAACCLLIKRFSRGNYKKNFLEIRTAKGFGFRFLPQCECFAKKKTKWKSAVFCEMSGISEKFNVRVKNIRIIYE